MNEQSFYKRIKEIIETARHSIVRAVNIQIVQTYWLIGHEIVEEEQKGKRRACYGAQLLKSLSERLTADFGSGFDESNLRNIRHFYVMYSNRDALRHELSWTHYRILMRVENPEARSFYEIECAKNNWSSRELERQKGSMLFERLALSKDKKAVKRLAAKGQDVQTYEDMIKDPYVLEFTGLSPQAKLYENKLEQALIDLKIGKITHQDIGQMQMYVNYYDRILRRHDDNPTVGLLLCEDKKDAVVRYTLPERNKQIFTSRYKLYLPTPEELRKEMQRYNK